MGVHAAVIDAALIVGSLCVVAGVGWIYWPAGLIVLGLLVLGFAVLGVRRGPSR